MGNNGNGKRNGWAYNSKTLKHDIENNKHIKNIRKKLVDKKLKKYLNY
ncbi:MAG: hypothetical protein ACFFHD_12055 [Promethearchaeota archaeon]